MKRTEQLATRPSMKKGQTPIWALRLSAAFVYARFTDKKGNVDKRRVGELLNVGPKTVESWITGRTRPGIEKLIQIREITKVSLDWIISDVMWPVLAEHSSTFEESPRTVEIMKK
jgi:hypothetical protein